jgi:hypothetical protein
MRSTKDAWILTAAQAAVLAHPAWVLGTLAAGRPVLARVVLVAAVRIGSGLQGAPVVGPRGGFPDQEG